MTEKPMRQKKGKNFKDAILEEKNKGRTRQKIMKAITRIDSSLMYGGTFLAAFAALDMLAYLLLVPSVFVWAGILVVAAVLSSVLAAQVTNRLKKQQWKYASA